MVIDLISRDNEGWAHVSPDERVPRESREAFGEN
jgi:hypothetical protein